MQKNVIFTMKVDKDVRDLVKDFCRSRGLIMKSFIEKAILNEIEKEELKEDLKEDLLSIRNYKRNEKDNTIKLKNVAEELGLYGKNKLV